MVHVVSPQYVQLIYAFVARFARIPKISIWGSSSGFISHMDEVHVRVRFKARARILGAPCA